MCIKHSLLINFLNFVFLKLKPESSATRIGGEIEESLSSSEFERFLAERAAAAENVTTENNVNEPRRNKDKQNDTMFAL